MERSVRKWRRLLLNPLVGRLFGFNINRRTLASITVVSIHAPRGGPAQALCQRLTPETLQFLNSLVEFIDTLHLRPGHHFSISLDQHLLYTTTAMMNSHEDLQQIP
ncbi:hypothetical protein M1O18_01455 [Dehalococcoidia bacterium]|nr:hypothetical protein [Dehalococcoidia bacterium]